MADWFSGVTYSFAPATIISSSEMNQNFTDLKTAINKAMPTGGIILWSGAIVDIPTGWALCNGSNGTSDLRDKFVIAAGSAYAVNDTGGEATHTLTESEIPVMTHSGHTADRWYGTRYADSWSGSGPGADVQIGFNDASIPNHGGGAAHNNLPPYFAKAYIQKTA